VKNYPYYDVPRYETFLQMMNVAKKYGDKPAFVWYDRQQEQHTLTYTQLCKQVDGLKEQLLAMGLGGCHLAIVSENSLEWIVAFLGTVMAGGIAVCVDIEQSDDTIRQLICQADSDIVVASPTFHAICAPLLADGKIKKLISTATGPRAEGYESLDDLVAQGCALPPTPPVPKTKDDVAAIVFTSGTTSKAKPVMLSQLNIQHSATSTITMTDHGYKYFSALPFYHSYGLSCTIVNTIVKGGTLTLNSDLRTMMRDIKLAQPDSAVAVPLMCEALYNMLWMVLEKQGKADEMRAVLKRYRTFSRFGLHIGQKKLIAAKNAILGPIHVLISGGAHLDLELWQNLNAFGIGVYQGYGITECSPMIATNRNKACRLGSVGLLVPLCELKTVDGEIWIKGPNIMKGYYKDPESTAEVMDGDWFKTGDLGYVDKDGFIFITGRIKNLIVLKNGKKISPEKIEELIGHIPMVKDVMVYGAASGTSTDDVKPAASIYPDPQQTQGMSSYEILEHLQTEINKINATLPVYQQVQMINIREKEFNKTASKKIKRYDL